ncbi:MAG: sugar transferase [Firmicutes bacterium]|nr:sugar transferase [Bacillota bacterium]
MIPKWEKINKKMRNDYVKEYFELIKIKKKDLILKRIFDIVVSFLLLVIFFKLIILIAILIKITSKGKVFFKQRRVTQYGNFFNIIKFRTMDENTEYLGSLTCENDCRVTKFGRFLRKFKIDEIPQLINVLLGNMTFIGTRPEIPKYVKDYSDKMFATLLLPAGMTSYASIKFRNEEKCLKGCDPDLVYMSEILPLKMEYNLEYLKNFNFLLDLKIFFLTIIKVFL